ncbi:MAG TPA: type II toxin-antitoxin system VapC family toxin [Herpetosiphonaceae bacterium]|nr:type II toxin-antitoxin system VapC family toxin [Herpetosiphonaceae bacterium]
MQRAVADTHTLIWYLYGDPRLSARGRTFIDDTAAAGDEILFSSITLAEIVYLAEKGRIPATTLDYVVHVALQDPAVFVEVPVDRYIARAMRQVERAQVPDFPDRIIAATAAEAGLPVISRDGRIRLSTVPTIW